MSTAKVEKRGQISPRKASEGLDTPKPKRAVTEPPRAQYKGPIQKGPRGYINCPLCTTLDSKHGMGVPVQLRKKHMKGHRR